MIPSLRKIKNDMHLASERREERLRRQRLKAKRRSLLEKLEDRRLLATIEVTNELDSGTGSLRAAIEIANKNNQADTIQLNGHSIKITDAKQLILNELGENNKTTIQGPGTITLGKSQLLINTGAFASISEIEVTGATERVAIRNFGSTEIFASTIYSNFNGALEASSGKLTVVNSTISNNSRDFGGGISVFDGEVLVVNSTLTNNLATVAGGGIHTGSFAANKKITLHNTIIAGNSAGQGSDLIGSHLVTNESSNNLVGDASAAAGLKNAVKGNIVGVNGIGVRDINTVIDTILQPNGGHTQTHNLKEGSPAIDAGENTLFISNKTVDQRGISRVHGAKVDIGAVEVHQVSLPNNFVDVDQLRFVSTDKFTIVQDANGTRRTTTGSVDIGLNTFGTSLTPLLHLRGGVEIITAPNGKSTLSTDGVIATGSQSKYVDLMVGSLAKTQKLLIPLNDLTAPNGYVINQDYALESKVGASRTVTGNKVFKPASLTLSKAVSVDGVFVPEHLKMSGFLQFDALDGAGIQLEGVNHFRITANNATAVINSGQVPLRAANNKLPTADNPINLTLAGAAIQFGSATMDYDKPTQEFKLKGIAKVTFEGGNAEIAFGGRVGQVDPNSFIVIRDGIIQEGRTTSALVSQFTIANVRFNNLVAGQSLTASLNLAEKKLTFTGRVGGRTSEVVATPDLINPSNSTDAAKAAAAKAALAEVLGPEIELITETSVTWELINGHVAAFAFPIMDFDIGRLRVGNNESATTEQKMRLTYDPINLDFAIRGSKQTITQLFGSDRQGQALARTALNVGLDKLNAKNASGQDVAVLGTGVKIRNGRFDRFTIPIEVMNVFDSATSFWSKPGPGNTPLKFEADYNPSTNELRVTGTAQLGTKGELLPNAISVNFGTIEKSGYQTETVLQAEYDIHSIANAADVLKVAYRIESITKERFRFDGTENRAVLSFPTAPNNKLEGKLKVTHTGGGIWYKTFDRDQLHRLSVKAVGEGFTPHFVADGYFEVEDTKLTVTGMELIPENDSWLLQASNNNTTRIHVQIDGQQVPVEPSKIGEISASNTIEFQLQDKPAQIHLGAGLFIAGVQIVGSGDVFYPKEELAGRFPRQGFMYKSSGPVDVKFGDTNLRAIVNIDLQQNSNGSLGFVGGKLEFVRPVGGSDVGRIQNISFSELSAAYSNAGRKFELSGKGTYVPNGLQVSIGGLPGKTSGQLSFQNGAAELTNFIPPQDSYNVGGIVLPTKDLKQTGSFFSGDFTVTFTGGISLEVGGIKVGVTLGGSGTSGLVIKQENEEFKVLKVGGTLFGEFTIAGVKIKSTGTLDYDSVTKELKIGGKADIAFTVAGKQLTAGVELNAVIKNGKIEELSASVGSATKIEVFGLELLLNEAGFKYNSKNQEFGLFGSIQISTARQGGVRILDRLKVGIGNADSPGFVIKEGELETIDIMIDARDGKGINLFGATVTPKQLRLKYSRSDSTLALTGGLDLSFTFGKIGQVTASAAFPGRGLEINTGTGQVKIRGLELSVAADKLPKIGPVGVKQLSFKYEEDDEGNITIGGSGEVELPGSLTVAAEFEVLNGRLNKIRVKVSKENPGIAIGQSGVFLTSVEGGIEGLADPENLKVDLTVTGSFGPTISIFGQRASLVRVSGSLTFIKSPTETSLTLDATVTLAEGYVGEAQGTVKIYFDTKTNEFITIDAKMRLFPGGILRGDLDFKVHRNFDVDAKATLEVVIPENVPIVGGYSLGRVDAEFHIRPKGARSASYGAFTASIDLTVLSGEVQVTANFAGELKGSAKGTIGIGFFSYSKSKAFSLRIPGTGRDLEFEIPDVFGDSTGFDVPAPELTLGDVTMDADGPGGTISFTGTSHLPDETTIDLYVDNDGDGYDGQMLVSGLALREGQQTYRWSDLAAFASSPYDPNQKLFVYGRIHDRTNLAGRSNYSAAITPPDFNPSISVPGEHSFGTNQTLVFSTSQQNAISFNDPLAVHDPSAKLVVTLDVFGGTLTLDPQQATPWTNVSSPTDVDGTNGTGVGDALQLISMLNDPAIQATGGQLPSQRSTFGGTPMYDVNGDGKITAADVAGLTATLLTTPSDVTTDFAAPNVVIEGNGTGRLLLIGTAAEINRSLDGLTYRHHENGFFDDRLEATVNRFSVYSSVAHTASIPLSPLALTVGATDGMEFLPVSYEQGSEAANLLSDVRIASASSGHIQSAMIAIDGYDAENDVLHLSSFEQAELGIDASFDSTTGKLHLTGSRLIQDYQRAIALTTFSSHGTGERVLRVHLGDRASNVADTGVAVHIIAMNQAPVVKTGLGSTYVSGSSTAVSLLPSITVQDADSATLQRAVITLDADSYHPGEDVLTYNTDTADNITGRFNALTGELVLSGEASAAAWSAALSRVKYRNTLPNATPGIRQLNITVDDGNAINSTGHAHQRLLVLAANSTLQSVVVGNLPTATATEVNDEDSITLAPALTLTAGSLAIDSLVRVDVAITDNFIAGSDFLSVDGLLLGMDLNYDVMNGVLSITGDVPIEWYEFVLQHVNYSNRSLVHDGAARTITFTVFDGFTAAEPKSMTAQFEALPVVQAGMEILVYETGQTTQPLDPNINVMYAGDMLSGATVEFTWDYLSDQDRLLFTTQNGITGNFDQANGVLTLTGAATVAQYQAALRSIQYTNTRTNPLAGLKQLDVVVQDGNTFSDPVFVLLAVDTQLVAPTVTATTTAIAFTEGNAPIVVAADLTISEQDAAHESGRGTVFLTSATVFIDGYVPGEDVLTFDAFESEPDADGDTTVIDGNFDVDNGVLFLNGGATPDQYQAVLRSVRYENLSAAPSTHSRVLNISVSQGIDFADAPPITVTVTSLNDAPTRIVAPPASATLLENAIVGSLGLEAIDYAPPSPQQPYLVLTVSSVPDATLGSIELTRASGVVVAAVGGVYTLAEIRSAVFVPALNASGTGTFVFTVAGFNPILSQPDPAHLTESISIEVAGVDTANPGGAFVAQVFRDLLGRNATQQELDALDSQFVFAELSDNGLREDVVAAIRGSREYGQRVVTEAYERLLGRAPTQAEIEPWLDTEKIEEDFADGLLPATLQLSDPDAAGSVEFRNGAVVFTDQFGPPFFSLQTVDSNILNQNFTAEVTVSIPSSELGFFGTADSPQTVDVVGNTAYVVYGTGVLRVLDVSNPSSIVELGFFDTPGFLGTLQVVGNKAYLGGSGGLRVLDVSNPANITELGFFVVLSSPRAMQVVGNNAYIADQFGLRVLDVSDPANISELGSFATPSGFASDVQVIGDIAYVVITRTSLPDSVSGLRVLNVSDPANISELGFFGTDQAMRLQVIDSTAYIADLLGGLRVLDVSNPAGIGELGFFVTGDFTLDVKVINRTAYVTGLAGFQVLDVSNPANISKFASFDLAGRPNDWQFIGSTAYVAVGGDGLRVLDVPSVEEKDKGAAYFGLESSDGLANRRLRVAPNQDSSVDVSFFIDSASQGGAGTHRLQVRWNASNQTAVFAIDEDYAGGDFVADYTFFELSNNIDLEHLYFGSGAGTSFDDFAISFESRESRLDEVNNHILSSPEYFTAVGGGSFETFVQAAFDDLVDREPTAEELDAAVSLLQSGTSRADIARQIEFSDQATGIVADQLFEDLLRRTGNRFETVDTARRIHDIGAQVVINGVVASTEYYVRYGTQTSADSRSTEEIEATNAELIRQWLEGTPTVGNSQVTTDFDAVGTINTDGRAHGGGTLIASQYVLTAAHLVAGKDLDSLTFSVGLTSYGLEEVHVHPDYLREFLGTEDGNDIAILKLNRPVVDVEPVSLWVGDLYAGDALTLVGFGPHPGDDGFGTKRAGTTPIDGLTGNLVTWTYDGADEATTVPGDSGSPQFLKQGETYYVTSVTSGGTHQALSLGDFAYNTRVSSYFDWIDTVTDSQVTRSVSKAQGVSFTASSLTRGVFPSSFATFNNHANIEFSGDDLLIQDISTTGDDNAYFISTTATDVVISDAHQKLTTSITAATGNNSNTIMVPLSSFTGNIIVRSAGGNDVIDVTTPSRLVNIDAGDGTNRLVVNGSDAEQSEEFFVRESLSVAGSLEVNMPTVTTDGPYIVQATRIHALELNTGFGDDTVRPQNLSGLTTPLVNFSLNLGDGDDVLNGINGTVGMIANGEDGNDSLIGGAGSDQLTGSFGDDSLAGGPGDDTYVFGADDSIGADTISENPGEGSDSLDFSPTKFNSIGIDLQNTVSPQSVTTSGNLLVTLSEDIENVTGGSHGNAIIGDAGVNILRGGNGVDYIIGGGGADQISGEGSADILNGSSESQIDGGDGADLIEFSGTEISFPNNLSPVFVLSGIVPRTDYDQVLVSGNGRTVTLGGNLEVSLDDFAPQSGDRFTIVDLQGASSVINGTFNHDGQSLAEGGIFTANGHRYSISYAAGDGNDVALTYIEALPGVIVTTSSVVPTVTEGGAIETLQVALRAQPTSDVVINVTSDDETEASVNRPRLTFTPSNWNIPQTVTITGVNDEVADGNQSTTITFSVDDAASADTYDSIADIQTVVVTIDDDVRQLLLTKDNDTVQENAIYTGEAPVLGGEAPVGNVTYRLSGTDAGRFTVDASTGVVSMVARNFEVPADADGDNVYQVTLTASDDDTSASVDFTVRVADVNDTTGGNPVLVVSPTGPNGAPDTDPRPGTTATPTTWARQRSSIRQFTVTLPAPVTSASASDLVLTNLGVNDADPNKVINLNNSQVTVDGTKLTISFPAFVAGSPDNGALSDGRYQLDLLPALTGGNTFTIVGDETNGLFVLSGDWNGSGSVTALDFATFKYWFGSDVSPDYVDSNNSGAVTALDFAAFKNNFGKSIEFPGASGSVSRAASSGEGESTANLLVPQDRADVNGDGKVTAADALNVINELNRVGSVGDQEWSGYDVNNDGQVTAADALSVINRLVEIATVARFAASMDDRLDDESTAVDELFSDDAFLRGLF